jgi:hypothetical protein
MAFRDPDALQNPFVTGLDHLLEIVVGKDARRRIATQGRDGYSWHAGSGKIILLMFRKPSRATLHVTF